MIEEANLLTHEILNTGMERLLSEDENGEKSTHKQVCQHSLCSGNLHYRDYLNKNLVPVMVMLLEQNIDGEARAAVLRNMLTTAFQIGANVALLGVREKLVGEEETVDVP